MSHQPSRNDGSGPSGNQEHLGKRVADFLHEDQQSKRVKETASSLNQVESRKPVLGAPVKKIGTVVMKVQALQSDATNFAAPSPVLVLSPAPAFSPAPSTSSSSSSASLLQMAVRGDSEQIFQFLMAEQHYTHHLELRTKDGDTALHLAAGRGYERATVVLLGFAANVEALGHQLRTPLHCAAAYGHLRVTQRLLDMRAKFDVLDANGDTALDLAVQRGHCNVVALFLDKGVSADTCNAQGHTLLVQAAKKCQTKVVELLLKKGASATKCKTAEECALRYAAQGGEKPAVVGGQEQVVEGGQEHAVRLLLRHGAASVPEQVQHSLKNIKTAAVVWAFVDVLPDAMRGDMVGSSFLKGARVGQFELMVAFLETGINIETRDPEGQTALHLTAHYEQIECLEELLRRRANVHAQDKYGDSPLHKASRQGNTCVLALLEAGANVWQRNKMGNTPLEVSSNDYIRRILEEKCK